MNDHTFNQLSLKEQADVILTQGTFIEAEDFYSFKILLYSIDQHRAEITFDYSGNVVNVEFIEKRDENVIPPQLDSAIGDVLAD